MNHIIAKLNKQKNTILANDGRLLKKLIFASIIVVLLSQPGLLGEIVQRAIVDAYLQVSVFVGFTLLFFIGLDSLTKFNTKIFLEKTKKYHVPISSFLGALPGCGGAVIIVTQFIQGRISFGSLVAVLTSTMGDAAFLILAIEPNTGLLIFSISLIIGTLTGYIIDYFHGINFMKFSYEKIQSDNLELEKTFVSKFNFLWLLIFIPGFILGILNAFQINSDNIFKLPLDLIIF